MAKQSELKARLRLKEDLPHYAANCLFIRTKAGAVEPFKLNDAQKYIHERLEEQRARLGYIRAIILKGRQQGCSTYVEGRFVWRTTHRRGCQAFILTHEEEATKNLFQMAKRYYEHLPAPVKPAINASNDKSLNFGLLDSGYRIGTAGNKSVGRSMTNQLFHGSEVAFWPNAAEHAKGILQTVPSERETEVIYESTANGLGNFFHQQWKLAESGQSEFIAIFVPWFWQTEYRKPTAADFQRSDEEETLAQQYSLDNMQLQWRRDKIVELSADGQDGGKAFKQEYPCNAAEAFQFTGGDGLISADVVMAARKRQCTPGQTFYVGVDPSRGGDRFAIMRRAGRKAWGYEKYTGDEVDNLGKQVAICKKILDTPDPVTGKVPDLMCVDSGGGADLVDRLHELGYQDRVIAISFGATPLAPDKYPNKRCEMWGELNLWLRDENLPPEIPDSDEVQSDLCASPYSRDSNDRIRLLKKELIIKQYGFSPDSGDALALTFCGIQPKKQDFDPIHDVDAVSIWQ